MPKPNKKTPKQPLPEGYEPEDFYAPAPYTQATIPVPYPTPPALPYRQASANVMVTGDAAVAEVSYSLPPPATRDPFAFAKTFTGKGASKRERGDSHDPVTGEVLAMARAYEELAARLHREARKRVRAQDAERHQQELRKEKQRHAEEKVREIERGRAVHAEILSRLQGAPAGSAAAAKAEEQLTVKKREPVKHEDVLIQPLGTLTYVTVESLLAGGGKLSLSGGRYLMVEDGFMILKSKNDATVREVLTRV